MLLEKGKIYKAIHVNRNEYARNYILFSPKENVMYISEKRNILCSFLINFIGELCLDKYTGLARTYTKLCKPSLEDIAEISYKLKGNGLTYNKITKELMNYGETRKG